MHALTGHTQVLDQADLALALGLMRALLGHTKVGDLRDSCVIIDSVLQGRSNIVAGRWDEPRAAGAGPRRHSKRRHPSAMCSHCACQEARGGCRHWQHHSASVPLLYSIPIMR